MENVLPLALLIGVDYDLFWRLNPKTLVPFHKAFFLKQQYDDTLAWSHGLYIRQAVSSVLSKTAKYPEKAMLVDRTSEESTEERMRNKIRQRVEELNAQPHVREGVN